MDKPDGPTSHDVVARARRLFRTRAVGHTGTLDPFATGLMVLVFGGATRLARWAERHRKTYRAVIRLGQTTDTDDRTGAVVAQAAPFVCPSEEAVRAAAADLVGTALQRPPAYSARRIGGERSYRLARRGEQPEPAATEVTVYRLEVTAYQPPLVTIVAEVSPGTYLRSLARDLGSRLECGAHTVELRRERIGPWTVADAHRLEDLTGSEPLLPPLALLAGLPQVAVTDSELPAVQSGRIVARPGSVEGEAALTHQGRLVAVGASAPGGWHPRVVLPAEAT